MSKKLAVTSCCSFIVVAATVLNVHGFQQAKLSHSISSSATALVSSMTADQKQVAILAADSPQQVGWHFIPKDARKGLELNKMSEDQRELTQNVLKAVLSELGHRKTTKIMDLERLLKELQDRNGGKGPIRDALRYYVTMFGEPSATSQWGLSFEGHHLSLNFVIKGDKIISSTPQFFATNPAVVKSESNTGIPLGTRVLKLEETLAFELVNTLSKSQLESALIAKEAPREIRAAGEPQPPQTDPVGVRWSELSKVQRGLLRRLIEVYVKAVPEDVAKQRRDDMTEARLRNIYFAWAGSMVPGVGHYYRVQGPTFLIEFVNTQPDADGNPANHIHAVYRDMRGDFAKSIAN